MLKHQHERFTKPKRVILLGGSGFVGRALAHKLMAEDVQCLSLSSSDMDLSKGDSVNALSTLIRPGDSVVILSALTPDKGKDNATLMKNMRMVQHVADVLAQKENVFTLYVSSDAVYAMNEALISEATPPSPTDLYGVMHRARELMLASVTQNLCIVRPTLIFGLDDTHNSYGPNRFYREALERGTITLGGGGEETRDHICVDDVAALLMLVLGHQSRGVLNLATGRSESFYEMAQKIAQVLPQKIKIVKTERKFAVTHRAFDVTQILKAFPAFKCSVLENALANQFESKEADVLVD